MIVRKLLSLLAFAKITGKSSERDCFGDARKNGPLEEIWLDLIILGGEKDT